MLCRSRLPHLILLCNPVKSCVLQQVVQGMHTRCSWGTLARRHASVHPTPRLATSAAHTVRLPGSSCGHKRPGSTLRPMAAAAAVTQAGGRLTQVDLQRFVEDHGIQVWLVQLLVLPVMHPKHLHGMTLRSAHATCCRAGMQQAGRVHLACRVAHCLLP
jgi:hypothetical protein